MADSWQTKTALIMRAADDYAKAYHKWHGDYCEDGDFNRLQAARAALYATVTTAVTDGVSAPPSDTLPPKATDVRGRE